jgi:hypothetical protein
LPETATSRSGKIIIGIIVAVALLLLLSCLPFWSTIAVFCRPRLVVAVSVVPLPVFVPLAHPFGALLVSAASFAILPTVTSFRTRGIVTTT